MGDWIESKGGIPAPMKQPTGIEGCPFCEGKGQYCDRGRGDEGRGSWVICMRCTTHSLILKSLMKLERRDLDLVFDLVSRLSPKEKV